jgi:hypothetical protein
MTVVSADQSKNIQLIFRKGEGRAITFNFLEDSAAYDISTFEFLFQVLDIDGSAILELTEGAGITNGGVTGVLTVDPSDDNVDIDCMAYWWKLKTTSPRLETWFNGLFTVNDAPLDTTGFDNVSVELDLGDIVVDVSLLIGRLMTGDEVINALTDADIAELYTLLLPYLNGETLPGGPSDYIGTLYERLLPYITGEQNP